MTDPYFGRATPAQFDMIDLAGWGQNNLAVSYWDLDRADVGPLRDDTSAARTMCFGRISLVRECLTDFGFDILRWREYLLEAVDRETARYGRHGYAHPYSFHVADRIVREAAENPDRPRQIALAEQLFPAALAEYMAEYRPRRHEKPSGEPLWLAAIDGWPFDRPQGQP